MPWISTAISAGGSLLGGMFGSDASEDAANAQIAAGREANALQRETRDLIRADNAPWMRRGNAAGARLADLMGLDVGGEGFGAPTRDDLRKQLLSRYTTTSQGAVPQSQADWMAAQYQPGGSQSDSWAGSNPYYSPQGTATSTVDEQGLNAEIDRMMAAQAQPGPRSADFGSLFKKFDASSVANDPGYQFALEEGTKANERGANARGGLYSGSTLKALARFNQGNATKYFGDAFNRDQITKGQQYNMLSGTAGTGQTAVGQVSSANQNIGNQMANTTTDIGNARASGYVGGANAWNSAIGSGINNYQQQQFINRLPNRSGSRIGSGVASGMYSDVTDIPMQAGGGY